MNHAGKGEEEFRPSNKFEYLNLSCFTSSGSDFYETALRKMRFSRLLYSIIGSYLSYAAFFYCTINSDTIVDNHPMNVPVQV